MKRAIAALGLVSALLLSCVSLNRAVQAEPLTVSAASDLMPAFLELGERYEQQTGQPIVFNFGSSGHLAQQIEHGAPVDLFAAANVSFVQRLADSGHIVPDTVVIYARGFLTLWVAPGSPLEIDTLEDLEQSGVNRIALAHPEHAPYGMAARQALASAGLWEKLQPKLVYAENVRQALQFAETGDVDVALVALSLSLASEGRWVLVDDSLHEPIDQALGVVGSSRNQQAARDFAAFIAGPEGEEVLSRYGFRVRGEGRNDAPTAAPFAAGGFTCDRRDFRCGAGDRPVACQM